MNANPETADIETSSESYAARFAGAVGAWFLKVQERATLRMLIPYRCGTVLDVGGGHGQTTRALIENRYRLTVLGSSEACKDRIQPWLEADRCSFKVGNILELPFPDQSFDVVMSYRLLPHVMQWEKMISELVRVSRKCIIIDYPSLRSLNAISPVLFQFKKKLEGNTRPFRSFWERDVVKVFKPLGFHKADRYPEFFLPMVLHRILKWPRFSEVLENVFRIIGMTSLWGSPVILKFVREEGSF